MFASKQQQKSSSHFSAQRVQTKSNTPFFQRKPVIGPANDSYEQEADRVADAVVGGQKNVVQSKGISSLQRKCNACEEEEAQAKFFTTENNVQRQVEEEEEEAVQPKSMNSSEAFSQPETEEEEEEAQPKRESSLPTKASPGFYSLLNQSRNDGSHLNKNVQREMSDSIGADFSNVRIHTDNRAAEMSQSIRAKAFTIGNDVYFNKGQYNPESTSGKHLLAHELTHVVQQNSCAQKVDKTSSHSSSEIVQKAGDPAAVPAGLTCPTSLTADAPTGSNLYFSQGTAATGGMAANLRTIRNDWFASGGNTLLQVHGYASTEGDDGANWTLSCNRANNVRSELIRLGIPSYAINVVAHGETTEFGPAARANRRAVITSVPLGIGYPFINSSRITPMDNFAGRSLSQFGVGEQIDLDYDSIPAIPADHFGGLEWHVASGGGVMSFNSVFGLATYEAPSSAQAVTLELRVASGRHRGNVIVTKRINIVEPSAVNFVLVPGTAPGFAGGGASGPIPAGTWGAGFNANVFALPKNVSFQGVVFGEGTDTAAVTGGLVSAFGGSVHPRNTFGAGGAGNITTGTPIPGPDGIWNWGGVTPRRVFGLQVCTPGTFLWQIPWEFQVPGSARTAFGSGFRANHRVILTATCRAIISKQAAGPFCRNINGTTC